MLNKEERRADVDRKQPVEILDCGLLDRRRLGNAGVGDQDVQSIPDNCAHLAGKLCRTIGSGQVHANSLCMAASREVICATTAWASAALAP